MRPAAEDPNTSARRGRAGTVVGYGLLGAASGATAALTVEVLPGSLEAKPLSWLLLTPGSLIPGLVFGLVIGAGLYRRGLIGPAGFAAYTGASTVSYLAAFTLAAQVLLTAFPDTHVVIGVLAGLFGSICLTGLSLPLLPFLGRVRPCLGLLAAGAALGALLPLATREHGVSAVVLFFALWQGGYAAVLSAAFPPRQAAGSS